MECGNADDEGFLLILLTVEGKLTGYEGRYRMSFTKYCIDCIAVAERGGLFSKIGYRL